MTREEAIEVVKERLDYYEREKRLRAACEILIPELRESEDERIRKELIEKISNLACGCFISQEQKQKFVAYLEKQKEPLTPEEKMKHPLYVEGFESGKQVGAQYEAVFGKQKERKPILEVFGFKVGDKVRLEDGDGRMHIIKSFEEVEGVHGPNFYHVEFEDNSARDGIYPGEEYPKGYYTNMVKLEN